MLKLFEEIFKCFGHLLTFLGLGHCGTKYVANVNMIMELKNAKAEMSCKVVTINGFFGGEGV